MQFLARALALYIALSVRVSVVVTDILSLLKKDLTSAAIDKLSNIPVTTTDTRTDKAMYRASALAKNCIEECNEVHPNNTYSK
jgi:hypothetical protein